ncbi:uncharacterized protein LOC116514209 [Thamnophis elegans]|uniref:uncharacterized protein LOC116514209 n=1 Tax=Thamnophis elegans TaxID=35005 RepID=UPI001378BD29|nr:uncharacterized protein LOC116514209 [Thamnophis elegans]
MGITINELTDSECLRAYEEWVDDQAFADLTIPAESQGSQHNMTPQPSTSRTAQSPLGEPSCKKAKMDGAGLPESLADSVSCDTMTVSQPEEDTHHTMSQLQAPSSVNSQNVNNVYLDMVQAWENPIRNFRAVEYYQRYRFINLDQIRSFVVAIEAIHNVIQILLNNVAMNIGPNDFVQLRLDAEGLNHPVFSHRRCMNDLNADDFLTSVENLLQSKAEILWGGDLQLVVTIVKNKEGGGLRKLNTLLLTKVLEKKRQHLVDFNVEGEFLCFASCLLCLIGSDGSKQEIITKARELHSKLGISTGNRIDFSQVHIFEKHLQVTIKILFYMQDGWRFFVTGHPQQEKIVFILLHDRHYYGVKNIKGFLGERYFCKFCHTAYHHKFSHGCQYICRACLKQECQQVEVEKGLCCRCKAPCRSKECAERHAQLAKEGKVECKTKQYCEMCGLYVFTPHKKCKEVKCGQCSEKVESLEGHLCFLKSLDRPRIGERYIIYDFECCQDRLDDEMRNILQRHDLSEDDKIKLYNSVLQRYLRLTRQNESEKDKLNLIYPPGEPQPPPTLPEQPPQTTPQTTGMDDILSGVSTRYRKNAELLLNKMKQHQDVSTWDERGTFLYKGVPIPGTNILDLVKGASQHRAPTEKRKPKGWDDFMNAMAEVNVPTSVLGSTAVKEQIEKLKDTLAVKDETAASPDSVMTAPFGAQKTMFTGTPSSPWTIKPRSQLRFGDWLNF